MSRPLAGHTLAYLWAPGSSLLGLVKSHVGIAGFTSEHIFIYFPCNMSRPLAGNTLAGPGGKYPKAEIAIRGRKKRSNIKKSVNFHNTLIQAIKKRYTMACESLMF